DYADDPATRARFLDEARAMARLSHPNVVQIHEAGESDGRLFIALELVDGTTLRAWLGETPRRWDEIVAAFRDAGEGLAAAHAAGIVHRDFKPDNVLRTRAGVVKVADFGLAGLLATAAESSSVMGTPRYMSPEQHRGEPADAKSDQFSFCVALFEALYRVPPFEGDSRISIMVAVEQGRRRIVKDAWVPVRVARVIDRGLAHDPAARWPDMASVLVALDRATKPRGRLLAIAALGVVALAAAQPPPDPCVAAGSEAAAVEPAAWAEAWSAARREGCIAHRDGALSAELFDRRQLCLDAALARVTATQTLAGPTPELEACTDPIRLSAGAPTPTEGAARTAWIAIREELARAEALRSRGRRDEATQVLAAIAARSDVDPDARAEATMLHAGLARDAADFEGAVRLYLDAATQADALRNDDLRARAVIDAAWVLGVDLYRPDEARRVAGQAEGALRRVSARPALFAKLHEALGMTAMTAGDLDEAARRFDEALARVEDDPRMSAVLHGSIATIALQRGDAETAVVAFRRALAVLEAGADPDDAVVGHALNNLGVALGLAGQHDEALTIHRRSLQLRERVYGPDAIETANALNGVGLALVELGRPSEAIALLERSMAIRDRLGGTPADRAEATAALARARELINHHAEK
ncbi:MAG TPA: serine/threonine-protein kinase, partial [Nannocystaceae bacterium]|nr:serine/threonine-protein kinase [Nannocystaceae bacterium]